MRYREAMMWTVVTVIILMFSSARAEINYPFHFAGNPEETTWHGIPAIKIKVQLDEFPILPCEACPKCKPPGPSFVVAMAWQDPNDVGGDPDCWVVTFAAYSLHCTFNIEYVFQGNGSITLLDPGQPGIDTCCGQPLKCK